MSEESVKINGIVQVCMFMILGLVYIAILYFIISSTKGAFLDNQAFIQLTNSVRGNLVEHGSSAKYILITGVICLSIISGMLIYDIVNKFSIVSIFLLVVMTLVDFVPLKILVAGDIL